MPSTRPVPAISRIVIPPYWFALGLLVEIALDRWTPIAALIVWPLNYVGPVLVAAGSGIGIWGIVLFRVVKTGIVPFTESTVLVTRGPYGFTRNPMYFGMVLILLGVAALLGSLSAFLVPPAFVVLMTFLFILPEEQHLESAFGDSYLERKRRVRRWL